MHTFYITKWRWPTYYKISAFLSLQSLCKHVDQILQCMYIKNGFQMSIICKCRKRVVGDSGIEEG